MLIGISGFAKSGKTEVAKFLEAHGFRRKHIAVPLRAMLTILLAEFGIPVGTTGTAVGERPNTYDYLEGRLKEDIIPEIGVSGRYLQITLGTEWGRELIRDDLWAAAWEYPLTANDDVINDSVRFPNEEEKIQGDNKGFTILVRRPGIGPTAFKWGSFGKFLYEKFKIWSGVHDSERVDRLNPDVTLDNDGTLEDLHMKLLDTILPLLPVRTGPIAIDKPVLFIGSRGAGKTEASKALKYAHKIDVVARRTSELYGAEIYVPEDFNPADMLKINTISDVHAIDGTVFYVFKDGNEPNTYAATCANLAISNDGTKADLQQKVRDYFLNKAS